MIKRTILFVLLVITTACGDAIPQVDFLNPPEQRKVDPVLKTSSNSLSQTIVVTGGTYKIKGRVTRLENQSTLSGGSYKIKGKLSF